MKDTFLIKLGFVSAFMLTAFVLVAFIYGLTASGL